MVDELRIIHRQEGMLPSAEFSKFEEYLTALGLPTESVIASPEERMRIMKVIPEFVESLSPSIKRDARYLSKFIAGSAIGLFDAALNFVWNEVIVNLRSKILFYGLDLFFDAAVGEKVRDQYNSQEDLSGIKDKTLLDTCRKLELINDLVYKKLSHILTMRNDIGSSHPNDYAIGSYELLGWLQTCITEVIQVKPSEAALTVKSIVDNLKKETNLIRTDLISTFESSIKDLSIKMTDNLLVTLFGLFTTESTGKIVQENILKLIPILWEHSSESVKYDLGEKVDVFKLNLSTDRTELAERFFEECNGSKYFSLSSRIINLSSLIDDLYNAHIEWDNFYHEVPIVRRIMKYIQNSEDIPEERLNKIIETFLICRTGNGATYNEGVSPGAKSLYDKFFSILDNKQIIVLLSLIEEHKIRNHITGKFQINHFGEILDIIHSPLNTARVNDVIEYLKKNYKNLYNVVFSKQYKELTKGMW
ncbi:hypothetical protein [Paenibacillus polymyxa]|uniref:hypothetical protein n=1 Tax=Paenibacillus polymyxa TaxID=1406 RepID=UPI002024AFC5|nr:hypothetical protein [Paenibacillus polymyxa]WGV33573.1 hypothetical protein MF627_08355 [Paenibacillus polymyxa]